MIRTVGMVTPLAVTAVIFFTAYNNSNNGLLVVTCTLFMNLGIAMAPSRGNAWLRALIAGAKPSAICLMSFLGSILIIEALFPFLLPHEYAQVRDLTKHSSLSWHKPGREFVYYGYDPNVKRKYVNRFRWNSRGYFDKEYPFEKPRGVKRIVVIGDSLVEAIQVPLVRTFHKLLEVSLNSLDGVTPVPRFEVIALGHSGTGQVEHLKVLKREAINYSPDAVIMTLYTADFCRDDPDLSRELILSSGQITPRIRGLATHGLLALAFALRRLEEVERNKVLICPELLQWADSEIPRVETAWERTLGTILAARDFCQERGIMFTLVYLGSELEVKYAMDPMGTIGRLKAMGGPHQEISWNMSRTIKRVREFCAERGVSFVSLLEPLIAARKETGKYVFGDHYTIFGHQVAARILQCALISGMRIVPSGGPSYSDCSGPGSWRAVVPQEYGAPPGGQPGGRLIPAPGPAPESR